MLVVISFSVAAAKLLTAVESRSVRRRKHLGIVTERSLASNRTASVPDVPFYLMRLVTVNNENSSVAGVVPIETNPSGNVE